MKKRGEGKVVTYIPPLLLLSHDLNSPLSYYFISASVVYKMSLKTVRLCQLNEKIIQGPSVGELHPIDQRQTEVIEIYNNFEKMKRNITFYTKVGFLQLWTESDFSTFTINNKLKDGQCVTLSLIHI